MLLRELLRQTEKYHTVKHGSDTAQGSLYEWYSSTYLWLFCKSVDSICQVKRFHLTLVLKCNQMWKVSVYLVALGNLDTAQRNIKYNTMAYPFMTLHFQILHFKKWVTSYILSNHYYNENTIFRVKNYAH